MIRRLLPLRTALGTALMIALQTHAAGAPPAPGPITPAPAFTLPQLSQPPRADWPTNGGSLTNQRWSPLSQINAANVAGLKGVWLTHLGSALDAKYSAEGQPLEYDGVLYVVTGADDVFAVSVDTGAILWRHKAVLDPKLSTVCCGWASRGLALGDGKVFVAQLDGRLLALDQRSGRIAWSRRAVDWRTGVTFTAAPLYADGRVFIGTAGGELKTRGRLLAFDARTGREAWHFYTVPGPGEPGHETWPQDNDAWRHGGAAVWQTPSVDPALGLIYFSTGNASPDDNGSGRAGANLYASSLVALDLRTGHLRWAYQFVHHDIWDYDAPSPTILFDVGVGGRTVHAIGEAPKTGWLYLLDRTTGRPLFPVPERPVPQDATQKTWPTQPIPAAPPLVNQVPTPQQAASVRSLAGKDTPMIVAQRMFTPYWKTLTVTAPGPAGGTNWPPSSYDPQHHLFYVCSQNGVTGLTAATRPPPAAPGPGGAVGQDVGSMWTVGGGLDNPGEVSAVDVTTGRLAWQAHLPDSCFSGSVVTAGNLLFVGRNTGELQAFNAATGAVLWRFQTGAGANNTATVFERHGREYLAFYAGGNALAGTAHGDNLWLFGLDGTLGPVAAGGASQALQHAGAAPPAAKAGDPGAGTGVYAANCAVCHGTTGHGSVGGPDLTGLADTKHLDTVRAQINAGGKKMPSFKGVLTPQQVEDVSAYVVERIAHGH